MNALFLLFVIGTISLWFEISWELNCSADQSVIILFPVLPHQQKVIVKLFISYFSTLLILLFIHSWVQPSVDSTFSPYKSWPCYLGRWVKPEPRFRQEHIHAISSCLTWDPVDEAWEPHWGLTLNHCMKWKHGRDRVAVLRNFSRCSRRDQCSSGCLNVGLATCPSL